VLGELEALGLLEAPHTSAGRMPTDLGLRLFVDGMMQVAEPTSQERAAIERRLFDAGCQTMLLDGDQLRHGLNGDLGFSPAERAENIRRAGEAARLFFEQGSLVLCAFVSPYRTDRQQIRARLPEGAFIEVFVNAPLETCMRRDPKGLYARAKRGEVPQLTGVGAPYEEPTAADLVLDTEHASLDETVEQLLEAMRARGVLRG
jgi:bifunctional enzyme CysN/CysC